jgi:hypothetical protein
LESDVANMKEDLDEIKFLLRRLVNGSWWSNTWKLDQKFWICEI